MPVTSPVAKSSSPNERVDELLLVPIMRGWRGKGVGGGDGGDQGGDSGGNEGGGCQGGDGGLANGFVRQHASPSYPCPRTKHDSWQ